MMKMSTLISILCLCVSAHAMHEFEDECPTPGPTESIDLEAIPPGHAKKLKDDLIGALQNPGTLKQLVKRYPSEVIAVWRANPELGKLAILSGPDKSRVLSTLGEGYSGCLPTGVGYTGTLQMQVETFAKKAPRIESTLELQDGRILRVSGVPGHARGDRSTAIKGWLLGHDILVGSTKEDFQQPGTDVPNETWNSFLYPDVPLKGNTPVLLVGWTFDGDLNPPTMTRLNQLRDDALVHALRISDPDGPTGPLPPVWTPDIRVHPTIVSIGPARTGCPYNTIYSDLISLVGWTPQVPGDAFYPIGNFVDSGCRWGGLGGLCARGFGTLPHVIRYAMSDIRAEACTINHELLHTACMMHEEGLPNSVGQLPGPQGPFDIQPYGWIGPLGNTGQCVETSPAQRLALDWTPSSHVHEIVAPGTYVLNDYKSPDDSNPRILRIRRTSRVDDFLDLHRLGTAARTPLQMRTGYSPMWRTGNRFLEPVAVNCTDVTGHVRTTCPTGQTLVEPWTGMRLTLMSETSGQATVRVEQGPVPTTVPTTTSTSTTILTVELGLAWDGSATVGVPERFTALARWPGGSWQTPHAVRWTEPEVSTVNPLWHTFTQAGWNSIRVAVWLDGTWSTEKHFPISVQPSGTTTSTLSSTSTTSSSTSTSTSTSHTSTSVSSTSSSTSSSSVTSTSTTTSTTSTTSTPTTSTTTSTWINHCSKDGLKCNHHSDCRGVAGCEGYRCGRKWWHLWYKRCWKP